MTGGPWLANADPGAVAAELQRRFPGVLVWFGEATGRWWAMLGPRTAEFLVEATDPVDLGRRIRDLSGVREIGRATSPRASSGPDGAWLQANTVPDLPVIPAVVSSQPQRPDSGRRERRGSRHWLGGRWLRPLAGLAVVR